MPTPTRTSDGVPLIDRRAHQFQLGVAAGLNLLASQRGTAWPLVAGAAIFGIGSIDFPDRSPVVQIWSRMARHKGGRRVLIDARPAGVMSAVSVPSFLLPAFLFAVGAMRAAKAVTAIAGTGLAVEAVVGRCVTCETYRWLAGHGVVKPTPPLTDACIAVSVGDR